MPIGIQCGCVDENCQAAPHKGNASCSTVVDDARFDAEGEFESNARFEWPEGWEEGRCASCVEASSIDPDSTPKMATASFATRSAKVARGASSRAPAQR